MKYANFINFHSNIEKYAKKKNIYPWTLYTLFVYTIVFGIFFFKNVYIGL